MKKVDVKLSSGEVLQMSEPSVRVFKKVSEEHKSEMAQAIAMIAILTNKQGAEIEDLGLKDFKILQDTLKGFLVEAGFLE